MNIGLLGIGTVGGGVYELVGRRSDMQITRVLCRREVELPGGVLTHDAEDILRDGRIDTVVEVLGGLHPALEYVRAALLAGKNVVTANKALLAQYYDELIPLAERQGTLLRCTAAVGGGISWLSELERVRRVEEIERLGGIMNGTCNYILDAMGRLGLDYDEALRQAQSFGYAEADPSADVDGLDTWHKLILSANVAFGVSLKKESVPVAGIRYITGADVARFKERGLVCKLTGTAVRQGGALRAYVQPTLVPEGQPEAAVPANYNLIALTGALSGRRSFFGQGAGRYPTAHNVVQDCVDVLAGRGFYVRCGAAAEAENSGALRYYVRCEEADGWPAAQTAERWGGAAVTVPVPVERMHAWLAAHPGAFIAALPEE